MSEPIEPARRPDFDDEADGLDCFAAEGASVVDEADDAANVSVVPRRRLSRPLRHHQTHPRQRPSSPAIVTPPGDRASIERLLEQYRDADDRLDAPSAAVIWPRVGTRALTRAFSTLVEQDVSCDSCDLDISGARARARCVGEIRYVRRVGDQTPRVQRLSWSFALERVSDR